MENSSDIIKYDSYLHSVKETDTIANGNFTIREDSVKIITDESSLIHEHWKQFAPVSYRWHVAIGLFMSIVGVIAFIGNILVISIFVRHKAFRVSANLLVLNLAIADLTIIITNFLMLTISSFAGYWVFGTTVCKIFGFLGAMSGTGSINTLTMIAFERFTVIVYRSPWKNRQSSTKSVLVMISFIWLYSLAWASMPLIGWGRYIFEGSRTSCTFDFFTRTNQNEAFVLSLFICSFILQLVIISVSYIGISVKILAHKQSLRRLSEQMDGVAIYSGKYSIKRKKHKVELQVAKISFYIIILFCVSWLPYAVICLLGIFGNAGYISPLVSTIPGICAKISTAINPIVYALLHPKYRKRLTILTNFKMKTFKTSITTKLSESCSGSSVKESSKQIAEDEL